MGLNSENKYDNQELPHREEAKHSDYSYDTVYNQYAYEDEIDLRELIATIWDWRRTIVAITILSVLTAGIVSFFVLEPVYEASAHILTSKTSVPNEVIKSPYFMMKVIEELNLPKEEKYTPFALAESISVQTGKSAESTVIKIEDSDPQRAADIVNTAAVLYTDFAREKSSESATAKVTFLQDRLDDTKAELDAAQAELDEVRRSGQLEILSSEVTRLTQELNNWKSILTTGEVRREELIKGIEELEKVLDSTPPSVPGPPDYSGKPTQIPNQTYQDLETSLAKKQVELKELEVRLSSARSKIPPLTAEYASVYEEYIAADRNVKELINEVDRLNASITNLDAQIIAASTTVPEALIATPAVAPDKPVKPRKMLNMAVAGVLGLFVSILVVFFIEYWRSPGTHSQAVH